MKNWLKRILIVVLALAMVLPMPLEALAAPQDSTNLNALPVEPAKPASGKAADVLTNPDQPDLYTLYTDYKVQRKKKGETDYKYDINWQPYVATVGAAAKPADQAKVDRDIQVPVFSGYHDPKGPYDPLDPSSPFKLKEAGQAPNKTFSFHITYNDIKTEAGKISPINNDYGKEYKKNQEFRYDGKKQTIKIKHIFQDLTDFNKYGKYPGKENEDDKITTQEGVTGS